MPKNTKWQKKQDKFWSDSRLPNWKILNLSLIENEKLGTNIKVIKSYIHCTLFNIVKTGSYQTKQMYFSFFFLNLNKDSKCEKIFLPISG